MRCEEYKTDEDYVAGMRQGGAARESAETCLYREYRNEVLRRLQGYVGYRSGQREESKDLVQDAFITMTEKIVFGGYNGGSLLHFWLGIAKGLLRNKVKRDARTDLVDDSLKFDSVDGGSPEITLISNEQKQILHSLLNELGEKCKNVLLMWAKGYSMREIMIELDYSSEVMVRKTKFKCKERLVKLVETSRKELG